MTLLPIDFLIFLLVSSTNVCDNFSMTRKNSNRLLAERLPLAIE